jgi:hypothetical protein
MVEMVTDATEQGKKEAAPIQKVGATMFADENGNLKYVVAVCKHPRSMLWLVLSVSLAITFILFSDLGENPITDDTHVYDVEHASSVAYDSYTLASGETNDAKTLLFENCK